MNQFPLIGLGLATTNSAGKTLDTYFPKIVFKDRQHKGKDLFGVWNNLLDSDVCEITDLSLLNLSEDELPSSLGENIKIVLCRITQDQKIDSVEGAYLKLHLLSYKFFQPNTLNLDNLFNILPNVAWTNNGPIDLSEIDQKILESKSQNISIEIKSIDKFPRLVDYIVPAGVRIADSSRVRLGAYLSEGTTVMHEGFVNFNAGTLGAAMIEGRISAGVVIGENSDLGGGASTMGTLSGGNEVKISVGENCLIGANSGLGIPLGNNCIIEAGLYITGGSKVEVFDQDMQSKGIIKAEKLSNKNNILFIRNSLSGAIEARVNTKSIELNDSLHLNQ
jgi:2,3,4,5-tetrahydropyridine-2-carboxylate N-succinyltransferase